MATNWLPNIICPPPLYYSNSGQDRAPGHRQEGEYSDYHQTQLDLRQCRQHSTLYDPAATSLHWSALVGTSLSTHTAQTEAEDLDKPEPSTCTCVNVNNTHKTLPLLKVLAKEILSLKDQEEDKVDRVSAGEQTELTPEDEEHDAEPEKNNFRQQDSRMQKRGKFFRECCNVTDHTLTKSIPSARALRKSNVKAKTSLPSVKEGQNPSPRQSPRNKNVTRRQKPKWESKPSSRLAADSPRRPKRKDGAGSKAVQPRNSPSPPRTQEERPPSVVTLVNELDIEGNTSQQLSPVSEISAHTPLTASISEVSQPMNSVLLNQTGVRVEVTDETLRSGEQVNTTAATCSQQTIVPATEITQSSASQSVAGVEVKSSAATGLALLEQANLQVLVISASSLSSMQDQASVKPPRAIAAAQPEASESDNTNTHSDYKQQHSLEHRSESDLEAITTELEYTEDFESDTESSYSE